MTRTDDQLKASIIAALKPTGVNIAQQQQQADCEVCSIAPDRERRLARIIQYQDEILQMMASF